MATVVHLDLHLDPARLDEAREVLVQTLAATRAWPGNEGLDALVDEADAAHVLVVERWAASSDHEAYVRWRTTPEGRNRLRDVVIAAPAKTIYPDSIPLPF
jgi:quinol monooxygenase YgiN